MEQNNLEQQVSTPMPPKPDNNMVLAIACTVCCCLPFGIVGIIKASKVNGLYLTKQYEAAALDGTRCQEMEYYRHCCWSRYPSDLCHLLWCSNSISIVN